MKHQDDNISIVTHHTYVVCPSACYIHQLIDNYPRPIITSVSLWMLCNSSLLATSPFLIATGTGSSDVTRSSFWLYSIWSTKYFVINVNSWVLLCVTLSTTFWAGSVVWCKYHVAFTIQHSQYNSNVKHIHVHHRSSSRSTCSWRLWYIIFVCH